MSLEMGLSLLSMTPLEYSTEQEDSDHPRSMDGDGLEDYLAVGMNGAIELWLNKGYDTASQQWIWDAQGQIATGVAARPNIR